MPSIETGLEDGLTTLPWTIVSATTRVVGWVVLVAIVLLLAPWVLDRFDDPQAYAWTGPFYDGHAFLMDELGEPVRRNFPTRIQGEDRTEWVLLGGLLLVAYVAARAGGYAHARVRKAKIHREVDSWKSEMGIQEGSEADRELEEQIEVLETSGKASREELLKVFAETKRKLEGMGRELAFLSIDVVGSTEMKRHEESAAVQYDFLEYRKLVERVFGARGVIQAAWTPDGVMAAFSDVDTAVRAGKDVIRSLEAFNRDVKLMKQDFAVRCGVNAGYVYFDDTMPLESVSDRVIDIAGHMQKYAEPNTVSVAKKIVEPLGDRGGFTETDKVVDGYEVFAWRSGGAEDEGGDAPPA